MSKAKMQSANLQVTLTRTFGLTTGTSNFHFAATAPKLQPADFQEILTRSLLEAANAEIRKRRRSRVRLQI